MLFSFQDFAPMLKAELFDPDHWATVFKNAGAKCKYKQHSIHNCSLSPSFFFSLLRSSQILFLLLSTTVVGLTSQVLNTGTGTVWMLGHTLISLVT